MMKKIVIGIFSLILIEAFFYGQIFAQDTSDQWKDPDPNCIRHAENGACANYKETSTPTSSSSIWLTMTPDCMKGVGCKMDVAKMLGLKAQTPTDDRTSVLTFVQDLVLAATFFIGTIVTLAFIRSGVLFVMSGRDGDSTKRKTAQTGMINAAIGLLLVSASYAIVRLIQYLASGT